MKMMVESTSLFFLLLSWLTIQCHGQFEQQLMMTASPTATPTSLDSEWNETELDGNLTISPSWGDLNATVASTTWMSPAPTESPVPIEQVEGKVHLQLWNTPSLLTGDAESNFLAAVGEFIYTQVPPEVGDYDLEVIQTVVVRQFRQPPSGGRQLLAALSDYRRLQNASTSLFVDVKVLGLLQMRVGDPSLFSFDSLLQELFTKNATEFISILQSNPDITFFNDVVAVQVFDPNAPLTDPPTDAPVAPLPAPTNVAVVPSDSQAEVGPWSIGMIVGVAAGGAVIFILVVAIIFRLSSKKQLAHEALADARVTRSGSSGDVQNDPRAKKTPERRKRWSKRSTEEKSTEIVGSNATVEEEPAPKSNPINEQTSLGTISDLESQGLYSYAKNDSDSVMGASIMYNNSVVGYDNMSYAYSLEAGIEASVVAGDSGDQSTVVHEPSKVPLEIPQITVVTNKKLPAKSIRKPSPKSSLEASLTRKIDDAAREFQLSSSDLELTASELAMLPSNLRDSNDEDDTNASPQTKVVMAPPGKLGIVIDTTVDGPVVHHVHDASALRGKIFPGDIIVAIDNVDTRAMSASAITALMVKTAKQKRRLTILDTTKAKSSQGGKR
jgi:hypothetical protein